jgi:hypothetical protein
MIAATYVDSKTFTVTGNQTIEFHAGRRVKLIGDSTWYGTIESVSYLGNTTIVLTDASDNIDNTLTEVYYGIVSGLEEESSMPVHTHDGDEGSGGSVDHTNLTNKGSNTHLEIDEHITNTDASLTTLSGAIDLNTAHRTSDGTDHSYIDQDVTASGTPTFNSVKLRTTASGTIETGMLQWNQDEETLNLGLNDNVTLQIGQENAVLCRNDTGSTITNGTPVMFAGTVGNSGRVKIMPAIADGTYLPGYTLGVATESIVDGADGFVVNFGKVRGVNTTGTPYGETWNDGDLVYVSPTTAGYLTNVEPEAPNQHISIGVVVKAHSNGTLFTRPTWHCSISELNDVDGTALTTNGQILVWDNDNNYWDADKNINNYTLKTDFETVSGTVDSNTTAIGLNTTHRETIVGNPHQVTKSEVGLGNVPNTDFTSQVNANTTHRGLTNNPHEVDKTQVGLGNVPNTDFTSSVASNTSNIATLSGTVDLNTAHRTTTSGNPHQVTADDVNCLAKDNTTEFTPDADYEPATKKYVDDTVGSPDSIVSTDGLNSVTVSGGIDPQDDIILATINTVPRFKVGISGITLNPDDGTQATINRFSTDGTLSADVDTYVPTEKAVKAYVDTTHAGLPNVHHNRQHSILSDDDHTANANTMFFSDPVGSIGQIPHGTSGYVLTSNGTSSAPSWEAATGGFSDPMTTRGDIIYKNSSNTTTRLPAGTNGQVLTSDGTDISWEDATGGTGNSISQGDSDITVTDAGTGEIDVTVDNTSVATVTAAGLALQYGQRIDDFDEATDLGSADGGPYNTRVPTQTAVKTYVDNNIGSSDKIEEGNSSVEVVDTGTGYIKFVQDGTEIARLNADGFLIGDDLSNPIRSLNEIYIQKQGADHARAAWLNCNSENASFASTFWFGRGRGTLSSPSAVSDGDRIANIAFNVYDGISWEQPAHIRAYINGTAGTNNVPTEIQFGTTDGDGIDKVNALVVGPGAVVTPGVDDTVDLGTSSLRFDDIYATNSTIQTSDERLKTTISGSNLGLDFICDLRPVSYKWKDHTTTYEMPDDDGTTTITGTINKTFNRSHYGMIAQEVVTTLSGLGIDTADFAGIIYDEEADVYGLRYNEFMAPMIKAIQELKEENETLKTQMQSVLSRLDALES